MEEGKEESGTIGRTEPLHIKENSPAAMLVQCFAVRGEHVSKAR